MRAPKTEATLSVYTSHDRDLLFHGTLTECRERGVRIKHNPFSVVLDDRRMKVVNHNCDRDGSVQVWVLR